MLIPQLDLETEQPITGNIFTDIIMEIIKLALIALMEFV